MQITLKAARVNAGLTIKEACKKIGISHGTLVKWEKEPWKVNPETQERIGNAYNIGIDYINFRKKFKN